MGFRLRKSIKVAPGFRLNLSGSGASVTFGPRGLRYTIGRKGTRLTAGIPGTGISWTQYTPYSPSAEQRSTSPGDDINLWSAQTGSANYSEALAKTTPPPQPFESAPVDKIAAFSTSDLAPILNEVTQRIRLAPIVLVGGLSLTALAIINGGNASWLLVFTAVTFPLFIYLDRYRRSVKLHYDLTKPAKVIFEALAQSFERFQRCQSVWQIKSESYTSDWKRNAGAAKLNQRQKAQLSFSSPECIRGDLKFPAISMAKEALYFLPDAVLVVTRASVTALNYDDLSISLSSIRFIEDETTPTDTQIVDLTWRYVNKNGGPDRRFSSNRQLPICLYGEIDILSAGGLNARLHYSDAKAADLFLKVVKIACKYTTDKSQFKSITSAQRAGKWPSVLLSGLTILSAAFVTVGPLPTAKSLYSHVETPSAFSHASPPSAPPTKTAPAITANTVKKPEIRTGGPLVIVSANPQRKVQNFGTPPLPRPRPK